MDTIYKIRNWIKKQVERVHNKRLRLSLYQALPFWIASLLTGLVAVGYAKLFAWAEKLSEYAFHSHPVVLFVLTPACFVISSWMVLRFAPYSRGSGIPQIMASLELASVKTRYKINELLSIRVIITKIASSLVLVLGGGAIGREGPTIQVAGSVFQKINQLIPSNWPKITQSNMIMTGAAAGLAAAFNTPLGGIVFAVEELTKTHISHFRTALFSAVIIAGLTAQGLLGPYLYLGYPPVNGLTTFVFAAVILTAIISGLGGSIMAHLILKLMALKARSKPARQWTMIIAFGLLMAAMAYFINTNVLGSGKEVMTSMLFSTNKSIEWYTPVLRFVGPILSFVIGGAGGVFAPALSAGACVGGAVAEAFHFSAGDANLLILSGMVAFLTGVTRTPFTGAILVLEMTDRHSVIFYLMLAALVANLVSLLVDKHSFYDHLKKQYLRSLTEDISQKPPFEAEDHETPDDLPVVKA